MLPDLCNTSLNANRLMYTTHNDDDDDDGLAVYAHLWMIAGKAVIFGIVLSTETFCLSVILFRGVLYVRALCSGVITERMFLIGCSLKVNH